MTSLTKFSQTWEVHILIIDLTMRCGDSSRDRMHQHHKCGLSYVAMWFYVVSVTAFYEGADFLNF